MLNKEVTTSNGVYGRRQRALDRLEAQLKKGEKPLKKLSGYSFTELTPNDITRIKKEINILKAKL